jgi:hypothetical protein
MAFDTKLGLILSNVGKINRDCGVRWRLCIVDGFWVSV